MTTTPTPSPEAEALPTLPVVANHPQGWIPSADGLSWRNPAPFAAPAVVPTSPTVTLKIGNEFAPFHPAASHVEPAYRDGWNHCYVSAEAAIVALRAEVAELRKERDELRAARFAYASEFPPNVDGDPDVGSIHANIRALKAKQIDTDAVMRLADDYAGENYKAARFGGHYCHDRNAAREALRASLLGDGKEANRASS